jgi:hypothetical protein
MIGSGAANAWAKPDMRSARTGAPHDMQRNCRPANGGEILLGFAGSGDWVNPETGNVCFTDPRPMGY